MLWPRPSLPTRRPLPPPNSTMPRNPGQGALCSLIRELMDMHPMDVDIALERIRQLEEALGANYLFPPKWKSQSPSNKKC